MLYLCELFLFDIITMIEHSWKHVFINIIVIRIFTFVGCGDETFL